MQPQQPAIFPTYSTQYSVLSVAPHGYTVGEKLEGLQSQSFRKVLSGSEPPHNFLLPEVSKCQIS